MDRLAGSIASRKSLQKVLGFFQKRAFVFLVFSFLALRLGILLTSVEYVSWHSEEQYRGTLAKELIEGLKVPLWDYQADSYDGGSLWIGVLAVPFFLLFGPNLFSLKLVPFGFSLGTLILSYVFFKRFFDRKTALLVCLFLTLPPPVFTSLSLSAIGSHTESIFFSIGMLFCFYQFLYGKKHPRFSLVLFGFLAGMGFWFTSITFLTTFACLLSWFLLDRSSFLSRKLLLFLGSFLVGLLPFLVYEATHGFYFLGFLKNCFLGSGGEETFLGIQLVAIPLRIAQMMFVFLPFLFFRFYPFLKIPGQRLSLFYGVLALFLILPFLVRATRRLLPIVRDSLRREKLTPHQLEKAKPLPLLLFPLLFILVYSVSNYSIPSFEIHRTALFSNFTYFSPLYYFAFSILAMASQSPRRSLFPLGMLVGLGLMGQGSLLFNEPAGRAFHYRGYSYLNLGASWAISLYPFPRRFREFSERAGRFGNLERRYLYLGLAGRSGTVKKKGREEADLQLIHRLQPPDRHIVLEALGRSLNEKEIHQIAPVANAFLKEDQPHFYHGLLTEPLLGSASQIRTEEKYLRFLHEKHTTYPAPSYYFGVGQSLYWHLEPEGRRDKPIEIPDSLEAEQRAWIYRGLGAEAGAHWIWILSYERTFDWLAARLPSDAQADFFWGVGWGMRVETVEDRLRALDWLHRLPEETQPWAWEGFQAFEKWYGIT